MHRFRPKRPSFMVQFYTMVLVIFVVIIVFCSVALWVIARSITNSITALDKATKQISLGKLDEEIVVKGSNEIIVDVNLNSMRLTLKENQTRRSRFIMGVSHDLRTPIALIKGYTEALADGTVDQPEMQKKSLQIVLSKIAQLEDMRAHGLRSVCIHPFPKGFRPTSCISTMSRRCSPSRPSASRPSFSHFV